MSIKVIYDYFQYWNNKDIDGLRILFSPNFILRDWSIQISGKNKNIENIKSIFSNLYLCNIKLISVARSNNNFFCQITIKIKKKIGSKAEYLDVIDVITLKNGKINKIVAYKS